MNALATVMVAKLEIVKTVLAKIVIVQIVIVKNDNKSSLDKIFGRLKTIYHQQGERLICC